MPTNQYLPFATGGGANVLSPAAYAGLAARTAGFVAGTALSIQLNSAWRQGSMGAAVLGQFVGDIGGFDALDDGSVANLATSFERTLQAGKLNYAVAGGTANILSATLTPVPAAYFAGLEVNILLASANTTAAPTLNLNGLGNVTIVRPGGSALQPFDIIPGIGKFIHNGTNFEYQSLSSRLPTGFQALTAAGVSNFTVTAGVYELLASVTGAGGGGGGSTGSSAAAGGGGGGGATVEGLIAVTPGQVISCTVGAGGTAGVAGGNGGIGGSSSFGVFISAAGGVGGIGAVNTSAIGGAGSGNGSGGRGYVRKGQAGGSSYVAAGLVLGGDGGASAISGSGSGASTNVNPSQVTGPSGVLGSGGWGGASINGNALGGAGGSGVIIIQW